MIERLTEALSDEFDTEVTVHLSPPAAINAPAIIVTPGSPFLSNTTHGLIEERWAVIVAVSTAARLISVDQLRDLSLRIREAAGTVGVRWIGADTPTGTDEAQALSVNHLVFRHSHEGDNA